MPETRKFQNVRSGNFTVGLNTYLMSYFISKKWALTGRETVHTHFTPKMEMSKKRIKQRTTARTTKKQKEENYNDTKENRNYCNHRRATECTTNVHSREVQLHQMGYFISLETDFEPRICFQRATQALVKFFKRQPINIDIFFIRPPWTSNWLGQFVLWIIPAILQSSQATIIICTKK